MSVFKDVMIGALVFLIISPIAVAQYKKNHLNDKESGAKVSKSSEGCGCNNKEKEIMDR